LRGLFADFSKIANFRKPLRSYSRQSAISRNPKRASVFSKGKGQEEDHTMRHALRLSALLLALSAGLPMAAAQAPDPLRPGTPLQLTPEQRSAIYRAVNRDRIRTPPANAQAAVGAELPPSTELYNLPDGLAAEIPQTKIYRYTVVQGQVVIVDPTNLRVVEVIR
jgi:hypothetical protein